MLTIREKADEFVRWDDRIAEIHDMLDSGTQPNLSWDFGTDWVNEYQDHADSFIAALAAGQTEFDPYPFPDGYFDTWDWIDY